MGATVALATAGVTGCSSESTPAASPAPTTATESEHAGTEHDAAEWSYSGATEPDAWGDFSPTCAASESGEQSPIDITTDLEPGGELRMPEVSYVPMSFELENNGHTIDAVPTDLTASTVVIEGTTYYLQQFHLHAQSEHQIDGVNAPMGLHLVNAAEDGSLAVLGVTLEVGEESAPLAELFDSMPTSPTDGEDRVELTMMIDPSVFFASATHVAHYAGSLTTPPCSEGVIWNLFETPEQISQAQLDAFLAIHPENHRPVQELNGRVVDPPTL